VRWTGGGLLLADCVIESDIGRYDYWSFRKRTELIAAGERAAEAKIDEIKTALAEYEITSTEFHELSEASVI